MCQINIKMARYIQSDVKGSTTHPLFKRWYEHKSRVNNEKYNKLLIQKRRKTNIEDWYIELY